MANVFTDSLWAQKLRKAYVTEMARNEDEVLDLLIQNYIPVISRETPEDQEAFKKELRRWNPQIKDWTRLRSFEHINVYRKTPIYDVSLGFHLYASEERLDSGGTIKTENMGPTFDFKAKFIHDLEFFSYVNYRLLQKSSFVLDETKRSHSFPSNHSFEIGISWNNQFSPWTKNLALSWEQFSYLSFNNLLFRTRNAILNNLQISTTELVWFVAAIDYRLTIKKRGAYIRVALGSSPYGTKSLDDGSKAEDVDSYKAYTSFKYYIYKSLWASTYYQYAITKGRTETTQSQFGVYTGYSF